MPLSTAGTIPADVGRIEEDGFLIITGRLSRIAKIAGEMAPLEKIEEDMHAVLGATDRLLAVTSVPDLKKGERLIVLHLPCLPIPVADLTTKLGQRGLPKLWIPDDRDFYAVSELPLLGSGKLDLRKLKQLALEKVKK